MKVTRILSFFLALLILFSACSFAAFAEEEFDNAALMGEQFEALLAENEISGENVSFAYYDFGRDLKYVYNGDRYFESNELLKFPLAYLYFEDFTTGKRHFNEDVGDDNLRTAYFRSLAKDYKRDNNATALLIEKYGGLEMVKRAMYEITYTKVDDVFFESDVFNANYLIDFLEKYYSEGTYSTTDFKNMLITPLKSMCPGRFSETYIYDCRVTHRYAFSKGTGKFGDMGIVNSAHPFGFVIEVENEADGEDKLAKIAEYAYTWNLEYTGLLASQMTTLPDVPEEEKNYYDGKTVSEVPMMVGIIVSTVVIAAAVTIIYIVSENRKKNQDRLD